MKTPFEYLAAEFKLVTNANLHAIPEPAIHDFLTSIKKLIDNNASEDYIACTANNYAIELKGRAFVAYN